MELIKLTCEPLQAEAIRQCISAPDCGGEVIFVGTVRNHSKGKAVVALEFEAYEPMAILELEKIVAEIKERWPIHTVALHHRLGRIGIGEIPVIAGVSSAHRKDAFEACAYLMDRLKQTVPIWKKEFCEDGEVWVSAFP